MALLTSDDEFEVIQFPILITRSSQVLHEVCVVQSTVTLSGKIVRNRVEVYSCWIQVISMWHILL